MDEAEHISLSKSKCVRQAIFYHFVHVFDAPCKKHWNDHGGTISLICKALHLDFDHNRTILLTLKDIMRCVRVGDGFDGTIKSHAGRKYIIKAGSAEKALVATYMKLHCGFCMTTSLVRDLLPKLDGIQIALQSPPSQGPLTSSPSKQDSPLVLQRSSEIMLMILKV